MLVNQNCYLNCGGQFVHAFFKRGYEVLTCNRCSLKILAFTGSYDAFLKSYYQAGYFEGGEEYCGYRDYQKEKPFILRNFEGYYDFIRTYISEGDHLDVGCAAGYFVELMAQRGFQSRGIDVSEYVVDLAEPHIRPQLDVMPLHALHGRESSLNVVTMFDLIEHLEDPFKDLQNIHTLLKNDGYLFIVTGDVGSLYSKVLGKYNHFYAVPQHLFFFDRNSITTLLDQIGFDVVQITSKGKWVSFEYMSQIAGLSLPFLKPLLETSIVKSFLRERAFYFQLGDTMMIAARKR